MLTVKVFTESEVMDANESIIVETEDKVIAKILYVPSQEDNVVQYLSDDVYVAEGYNLDSIKELEVKKLFRDFITRDLHLVV